MRSRAARRRDARPAEGARIELRIDEVVLTDLDVRDSAAVGDGLGERLAELLGRGPVPTGLLSSVDHDDLRVPDVILGPRPSAARVGSLIGDALAGAIADPRRARSP